jgi:hypothetical protein
MDYKASLDTLGKIISVVVIIIFLFIGQRSIRALFVASGDAIIILVHGGLLIFMAVTLLFCSLYSVQGYGLYDNELIIRRPYKDRIINLTDIAEVRPVEHSEFLGTIRTFGNGGFFGYYGWYYNTRLGKMHWYVTQRKNRILIRRNNGEKIIISPDDSSLAERLQASSK